MLFIVLIASGFWMVSWQNKIGDVVPDFGGTYTEGLMGQPQHVNPMLSESNSVDYDISRVVFSGLVKYDKNLSLVPDLAEELPAVSPDGKTYTIKLKDKLYWQDGALLTADDVIYTYKLAQNSDYELPSALRVSWARVSLEKIDDRTLKITTPASSSTFLSNLTLGIMPKHIWENVNPSSFALSKFNLEPIGSGPYKVTAVKRAGTGEIRSMSLTSFDRYSEGKPYMDKLEFKFYSDNNELINAYQSREIMGLGYIPFDKSLFIDPNSKLQQIQLPLSQYQAVFINRAKNPAALGDVKVRLALAKSVDKKKIIDEVYGGKATEAYGPILPGYLGYHEQIPGADMNIYDPEKAKSILEGAGWILDQTTGFRKDKQGRTITVELATNVSPANVRVAEQLKNMWEAVGIQVILKIETSADLDEKYVRPRNYELLLYSENVGADPDPYSYWYSSLGRDPGQNLAMFSNKTADQLLADARTNIPLDQRAAKYKQFQEILVGDVPAIFLAQSQFVYDVSSAVKGLDLNSVVTQSDRFAGINKWYIDTKRIRK